MTDFGILGLDRREVPNKDRPPQFDPGTVAQGQVMRPQPASFQGVGKEFESLGKALSGASTLISAWADKEAQKERLNGALWYYQNKTEQELRDSGSKYMVEGYLGAQAQTAALQFREQSLQDILTEDKQLPPNHYRQKLVGQFNQLLSNVAIDNPYVKELVVAQATEVMPQLMQTHVKEHNKYNEEQTQLSLFDMYRTAANDPLVPPEQLSALIRAKSTLSPEKHNDVIVKTAAALASMGEAGAQAGAKFLQATGAINSRALPESASEIPAEELNTLIMLESQGRRFNPDGSLLKSYRPLSDGTYALGRFQVAPATATDPGYGITPAKDLSEDELERIGTEYYSALRKKYNSPALATMAYGAGPGKLDKALLEYGDPRKGQITYEELAEKIGGEAPGRFKRYKKLVDQPTLASARVAAVSAFTDLGLTPAQYEGLYKAVDRLQTSASNKFNKDKLLFESTLEGMVEREGNIVEAFKLLEDESSLNLTDSQKTGIGRSLLAALDRHEKEKRTISKIDTAVSTNALSSLSAPEGKVAMQRIVADLQGKAASLNLEGAEAQNFVRAERAKVLKANPGFTDHELARSIEAAAYAPVTTPSGAVNPAVISAYQDYIAIRDNMSPQSADKYAGAAANLFELASMYDISESSETALVLAKEQISKEQAVPGLARPKITEEELNTQVIKVIDSLDMSWWNSQTEVGGFRRLDFEIEQFKNSPDFLSYAKNFAIAEKIKNPNDSQAVARGVKIAASRAEQILGNVVLSGASSTLREDMGLSGYNQEGVPERAVQLYLKKHGPALYGDRWNDFYFTAPIESGMTSIRGVPTGNVRYDAQNKMFTYYPKIRERAGLLSHVDAYGAPIVFSAEEAGTVYKQEHLEENSEVTLPLIRHGLNWLLKNAYGEPGENPLKEIRDLDDRAKAIREQVKGGR